MKLRTVLDEISLIGSRRHQKLVIPMDISKHAKIRCQQRGIPSDMIELIVEFGTPRGKPGGAFEYVIREKDKNQMIFRLRYLINHLEKTAGKAVLVIDNQIITVYHKKS